MISNPKKIMFAISDTGGGHRSAAAAIIEAIEQEYSAQCTIVDLLRLTDFPGLKQAPEIYDYCSVNHLWLNDLFFRKTNSIKRINALTRIVYFQCRQHLERQVAASQPDMIVAVHPLVIGLLRQIRKMSNATWPIITVVTDLVTIHASWATPGADLYLVPTQEAAYSLLKYGIPSNRIIHTGFPIHPKFTRNKLTQNQARAELDIKLDQFTVLITGGGVGAGNMSEWVSALEQECNDKQILVITGNIDYVTKKGVGYYCPAPKSACEIINDIAMKKACDNVYHNDLVLTNGSMRIADIIQCQLDDRLSEANLATQENYSSVQGA